MCGIAGWINVHENIGYYSKIIESMTNCLNNRGPDSSGIWTSNNALIGHRRLSVIDLEGGKQPMTYSKDEVEYVISYNGELYNTDELKKELIELGHNFLTTSDTEVLLHSFIEWEGSCLDKLNGIFAFAVWNEKNRSLFLARDRFGIKPLFYASCGRSLMFASEIKALLAHPDIKSEIDINGLAEIFVMGPSRTPGCGVFKSVSELRPGYCMLFDAIGMHVKQYWKLKSRFHVDDLDTTVSKVNYLLKDSVERQLVSDVPICTFLSGGLDSSTISAISSKHLRNNGRGQLCTYSIDYIDNDKFFTPSQFQPNPDSEWVDRVSKQINSAHKCIKFDTPEIAKSLIEALHARDLPGMADIDSSLLLFCKKVKEDGVVVALSGECADEIFGGYPWFREESLLNCSTFPWMKNLEDRLNILSSDLINKIKPYEYVNARYKETLSEVPLLEGESEEEARRRQIFYLNIVWFMCTLLDRKDRMSMANGLEVRVPFCDHRLVEYVWNIPWNMKMLNGREKGLLREASKGILSDEVLQRKKSPYPKTHNPSYEKMVKEWLLDILNSTNTPVSSLIDVKAVRDLAESKSNYGKPWFGQLMAMPQMFAYLIQVDTWFRDYRVQII